jgi:hypothetical protein
LTGRPEKASVSQAWNKHPLPPVACFRYLAERDVIKVLNLRKSKFFLCGLMILASVNLSTKYGEAQDENTERDWEVLDHDDASQLTSAGLLTIPGLGLSNYSENGTYSFTDEVEQIVRFGVFDIRDDGRVCVDFFQSERQRRDVFLRRNGLVFLLTEEGDHFPVFFSLERH